MPDDDNVIRGYLKMAREKRKARDAAPPPQDLDPAALEDAKKMAAFALIDRLAGLFKDDFPEAKIDATGHSIAVTDAETITLTYLHAGDAWELQYSDRRSSLDLRFDRGTLKWTDAHGGDGGVLATNLLLGFGRANVK
jgi:hypothetical protein